MKTQNKGTRIFAIAMILAACGAGEGLNAQTYKFDFIGDKPSKEGYVKVDSQTRYTDEKGYGYDFVTPETAKAHRG